MSWWLLHVASQCWTAHHSMLMLPLHNRCMDSGSSNFKIDEQDPSVVLGRGLGRGKGVLIDAGLHNMYVHTIRRAKHFIYIENQFFTGVPQHPCCLCV